MMGKLRSIDEFKELQEKVSASRNRDLPTIVIPAGTCCQASGANDLVLVAKRELLWRKLTSEVLLRVTGCHGFCQMEPSVLVEPRGIFYPKVTIKGMERIIDAVAKGEVLEDELFKDPETGTPIEKQKDIPFFRKQVRAILGRNEKIDPLLIFDYIATGGYFAAAKVLGMGDPQ
jgi:NADH-quinone oxidoreductase subunit F